MQANYCISKWLLASLLILPFRYLSAQRVQDIHVTVQVGKNANFTPGGRLILHFTRQTAKIPAFTKDILMGVTPASWDKNQSCGFTGKDQNVRVYTDVPLKEADTGKWYYQLVYKQNKDDAQEGAAGNLYSSVGAFIMKGSTHLQLQLDHQFQADTIMQHPLIRSVVIKSKYLSEFSGHTRYLKASVLLPQAWLNHPDANYPICYRIPGLNGRYSQVNGLMQQQAFADWWASGKAPAVIYVFLDSEGPYGDTYQVDSENNGPCGKALTEELIPEIEKLVHYNAQSHHRYLAGRSTGGWVALGLQVFYPDFFDGTWSYSPDPVDFNHYGLINIYEDSSLYYNRYGYLQPGRRTIYGEPTYSMKSWIEQENTVSVTGDYRVSGGQFGAYNAVFGPRGKDGRPSLMFDPVTGQINHAVARQWEKYDLTKVLERNWPVLGPKLQGKLWVWMGDMDNLYSNVATRFLHKFLDSTVNPHSDASVQFTPMARHTQAWSDQDVIRMVAAKAANNQ
jgi:hypothetical protein